MVLIGCECCFSPCMSAGPSQTLGGGTAYWTSCPRTNRAYSYARPKTCCWEPSAEQEKLSTCASGTTSVQVFDSASFAFSNASFEG